VRGTSRCSRFGPSPLQSNDPLLTPADIRRLTPEAYEFLWRTILRKEHGTSYRHVDGHGIDCLTDGRAYQIYHHQGAAWDVVQGKFRDDLQAARDARDKGKYQFDEWVFISTFPFKDPGQREWFDGQVGKALPLRVVKWGDEDLCHYLARYPDLAGMFGLIPGREGAALESLETTPPAATPPPPAADLLAPRYHSKRYGILWGGDREGTMQPHCAGCFAAFGKWVPMSSSVRSFPQGFFNTPRKVYTCPLGHPEIVLELTQFPPALGARQPNEG